MEEYKKKLAQLLAQSGALFFAQGLKLKDGRPTPYFVNMGKFRTGRLNYELGTLFADMLVQSGVADQAEVILGPSYKGSAIANATVNALWLKYGKDLLFEYDRKEAKTHGESTKGKSLFVNGCLEEDRRIFIVDDVGTSMATKYELLDKIRQEGQRNQVQLTVVGVGLGVNREQTSAVYDPDGSVLLDRKGDDALRRFTQQTGVPVMFLAGIREIVDYLYRKGIPVLIDGRRRPLDRDTMQSFRTYLQTYGT